MLEGINTTIYSLSWEYIGEELVIFWVNPYTNKKEKIANFWWPEHPPEDTKKIEKIFETLANKMLVPLA